MEKSVEIAQRPSVYVKICGITNERDALLAVALGADALGFIFASSRRQVQPSDVSAILKRLPAGVETYGVFRDESKEKVARIVNELGLSGAQLHGHEAPSEVSWIKERVWKVIKAFPAGSDYALSYKEFDYTYLLLDAKDPGQGQLFDWSLARDIHDPSRLILSGGLTPDNLELGINTVKPFGVDVDSGVERIPGEKDATKLREFIRIAKSISFGEEVGEDNVYDWQAEDL